jgi:hypothetical protein
VAAVTFRFMDQGPTLSPVDYAAWVDIPLQGSSHAGAEALRAPMASLARVYVLAASELIVAFIVPSRRIRGVTRHVALDLATDETLSSLARSVGLASTPPRSPQAWVERLAARRGQGFGLTLRVTPTGGDGAEGPSVRLTLESRDTEPLTFSEASLRRASTALEVWRRGVRVDPAPPPPPPDHDPEITIEPGSSRSYSYPLREYARGLDGPLVISPKVLPMRSAVIPLRTP